jgi:putative transposase
LPLQLTSGRQHMSPVVINDHAAGARFRFASRSSEEHSVCRKTLPAPAIIVRLRSVCQWNHLPKDLPDDSSVHRTFQRWVRLGLLDRLWASLVEVCNQLGGVDWEWQAADGMMGKARMGKARMGGPHRPQPDRPGQTRREAQPAGGGDGRAAGGRDRGDERP